VLIRVAWALVGAAAGVLVGSISTAQAVKPPVPPDHAEILANIEVEIIGKP